MNNKQIIIIALGIFGGAVITVSLYMWLNKFTISETGTLGDGFNGLIAPFISFAGALLVYLSFRAQIRANFIITSQWQFDLFIRLLDDLVKNYECIMITRTTVGMGKIQGELTVKSHRSEHVGEDAFKALQAHKWESFENVENALTDLHSVLWEFLFTIDRIESAKLEDKDYLRLRCSVFYTKKLQVQITYIRDKIVNERKEKYYSAALVEVIDKLTAKTFHLQTKGTWGGLIK